MAKIFRFRPEAAIQVCLSEAQEQGLPVQMDVVKNGLAGLVTALYQKYGIGLSVDETSPYYQNFVQQFRGQQVNLRPPQAQPRPAPAWPQSMQQQQQQQPVQMQRAQAQAPVMQPVTAPLPPPPPGAVFPGQPLPPLQPPPHMTAAGVRQGQTGPVPVNAPIMGGNSGELPSLTASHPPVPSILE